MDKKKIEVAVKMILEAIAKLQARLKKLQTRRRMYEEILPASSGSKRA